MEQQNEIAKIAYEIYLMRNGAPGDPVSDWLTAERIFEERQAKSITARTLAEPVMVEEHPAVSHQTSGKGNGTAKAEAADAPVFLAKSKKKTAAKAEPAAKAKAVKKERSAAKVAPSPKTEPEVKAAKPRATRKKTATE